ncbi:hydroxyethylthiazole kinase [Garciella nitratireducens]|uniref:hydroxyethylthiazole kinase n=1 Tax=Garciella nitratireducens TaxID=218205 RepID=UPI001BD200C7|nr:hydroxyethylthiazole kinase [Garciella nitratireducens]
MYEKIIQNVQKKTPLVHCITNYVTVNDCANIALACGGSPIMADEIKEVEEITSLSDGLVINIGTLNEKTIQSMIKAGKRANELFHPVILDPVGAGASKLRTETAFYLLKEIKCSVIRGNASEIKTLCEGKGTTKGVDVDERDAVENYLTHSISLAKKLSKQTDSVVVITGAIDVVTNGEITYIIRNGHPLMAKITGTGCMLTTVIGCYCGANKQNILEATVTAVGAMGLCGELAYKELQKVGRGTSTYRTFIIDFMSNINKVVLEEGLEIERR